MESVGLVGFIASSDEHGETFSRSMHGGQLSLWHTPLAMT